MALVLAAVEDQRRHARRGLDVVPVGAVAVLSTVPPASPVGRIPSSSAVPAPAPTRTPVTTPGGPCTVKTLAPPAILIGTTGSGAAPNLLLTRRLGEGLR